MASEMIAFYGKEDSASRGMHLESNFCVFDKFMRLRRGARR